VSEPSKTPVVLFVCIRNAGRSQMAEALMHRASDGRIEARSAGSDPADAVHPEVAQALAELGIDVLHNEPKGLTSDVIDGVDVVVTMGCGDACPVIPGARVIDWDLQDPAGRPLDEVRAIRDDIARRVEKLAGELTSRD
jgi:arsenate reductase (thioredoxin)